MSKVTAKDVLDFFKSADLEIAELVHEVGGQAVSLRQAAKAKLVAGMAKARAARGTKKRVAPATEVPGNQAGQANQAEQATPTRRGPGRPAASHQVASVPAPAHTAAATAVESDTILA